ncbi:caspase-8-like [Carassius carassius]|uniref:caspase-8-like n=1 Tax=Carassius carassius TaxID=217509 RepID=UPI0028693416|nr:caspase-8-like [Carassius carassius]
MDKKKFLDRICQNKVFLLETLSVEHDLILQYVQQAKLITQRDYTNLSDIPEKERRVIKLLDKIMGKGEEICRQFIDLLGQDHMLENFPALKNHAILACQLQEVTAYKMTRIPRGICIIINNVQFMNLPERRGSDEDQNYLDRVFRWLGFEVVKHRNTTAAEMTILLEDLGQTVDGDCFVCCVLSHGSNGGVCGTDGSCVSVNEIRRPFTGVNCQRLAGKPKLFFIQACRYGGSYQESYGGSEMEVDTDFLIARATTDGHMSFRKKDGTLFIQSLCQNLEKLCPMGTDIQTILLSVNKDVSSKEMINRKQMPIYEVALTKKLILRPVSH